MYQVAVDVTSYLNGDTRDFSQLLQAVLGIVM
jgi:hypothetical protein